MTKEYTGPEFEIEFARAWLKYVEGGKVGVDPRTLIEQRPNAGWEWTNCDLDSLMRGVGGQWRWKPAPKRMVTIGYYFRPTDGRVNHWVEKELVAPEVECPKDGTYYYWLAHGICECCNDNVDNLRVAAGEVFLKKEDAQAMADWLAVCRRGGA